MQVIRDELPSKKRFALSELLDEVGRCFGLAETEALRITRIGGPGENIWVLESNIDNGTIVYASLSYVKSLALSRSDFLDELMCVHERVAFGVFDASFMFIQSQDRTTERLAARRFRIVEEEADLKVMATDTPADTTGNPGRVAQGIAPPGLPQIRTCPIKASGSSCHAGAAGRHTEWMAIAGGSG